MLGYTAMTMVLAICTGGTAPANCTTATAVKTFTEQMSTKSCPLFKQGYDRYPQYAPNYVRNRYKYDAVPGSIFVVTCK